MGLSSAPSAPSAVTPMTLSRQTMPEMRIASDPAASKKDAAFGRIRPVGTMRPPRRQRRGPLGDPDAHGAIRSMVGAVQVPFMLRRKFTVVRDEPIYLGQFGVECLLAYT